MARKPAWHFALRIKGVSLDTLPMSALADYISEFAALLGGDAQPVLDSIVRSSIIVRARQAGDQHPAYTRQRLQQAANDPTVPAGRSFRRLGDLMAASGARGDVVDEQHNTVIVFPAARRAPVIPELIVADVGTLDGQVVGVSGADDTVHLRLLDIGNVEYKITLRDLAMAQELAKLFRGPPVRVFVHGTWRRSPGGGWSPHAVYADRIEVLDASSAAEVFQELRAIKTGWSNIENPLDELAEIRGDG